MAWFKKIFSGGKPSQPPIPPPSSVGPNPSQEELENSKRMGEKREEREQKKKTFEALKLVTDGAKLQCPLCSNPMGTLKVTGDVPTVQDKPTATIKDNGKANVLFAGTCSKSPNSASPCAAVMQLGKWQNTGSLKVQEESPLLLKSSIKCLYGGVDVKITNCGQTRPPFAYDAPSPRKKEVEEERVDVTLGIFFDGTLNNRRNTEARLEFDKRLSAKTKEEFTGLDFRLVNAFQQNIKDQSNSYHNDFSNVARLWDFYDKNNSVYVEGIGTEDLKEDDTQGYAFGSGKLGVREKVRKGCEKVTTKIKQLAPNKKIDTLTFDVFGFSRGAAACRNFVYEVGSNGYEALSQFIPTSQYGGSFIKTDNFGRLTSRDEFPENGHLGLLLEENGYNVKRIRIRFLGIFDTVSSYHNGSNLIDCVARYDFSDDEEELHLHSIENVDKIVHFTAQDEYRLNFALTRLKTIRYPDAQGKGKVAIEKSFPGVHSDIGGSYLDNMEEIIQGIEKKASGFSYLEDKKWLLVEQGWYKLEQLTIDQHDLWYNYLTGTRKSLSNKYSFIPLHFMAEFAKKHTRPLPINQIRLEQKYALNNRTEYEKAVKTETNELLIRIKNRLRQYVFSSEENPLLYTNYEDLDKKFPLNETSSAYFTERAEQDDLRELRNKYLHWSSNYKGFGMEPSKVNDKWQRIKYPK